MVGLMLTLTVLTQAKAAEPAGTCVLEGVVKLKKVDGVGEVTDVVVYLKDGPPRARPEPETHFIKQKNFTFSPNTLVVMLNDRVNFVNDDDDSTEHSVFAQLGVDPFPGEKNARTTTFSRTFTREGPVHIQCNIHGQMTADILVLRSAAFTRPDKNGKWRITGLPRKAYTLAVWEPNGGEESREVAACATGPVELELVKRPPPPALHLDGSRYRSEYQDAMW